VRFAESLHPFRPTLNTWYTDVQPRRGEPIGASCGFPGSYALLPTSMYTAAAYTSQWDPHPCVAGVAASPIDGTTLHKFMGVGLAADEVSVLVNQVRASTTVRQRWTTTDVLVIDEVRQHPIHHLCAPCAPMSGALMCRRRLSSLWPLLRRAGGSLFSPNSSPHLTPD
jgi:hypothetical protein